MYGRTAVDLILVAGSLSGTCRFLNFCNVSYEQIGVSIRDKERT